MIPKGKFARGARLTSMRITNRQLCGKKQSAARRTVCDGARRVNASTRTRGRVEESSRRLDPHALRPHAASPAPSFASFATGVQICAACCDFVAAQNVAHTAQKNFLGFCHVHRANGSDKSEFTKISRTKYRKSPPPVFALWAILRPLFGAIGKLCAASADTNTKTNSINSLLKTNR